MPNNCSGGGRLPKVCHKEHVELVALYPEDNPTIWEAPDVLTERECSALLGYLTVQHPLTRVAHPQTKGIAWRDVDRCVWAASIRSTECRSERSEIL